MAKVLCVDDDESVARLVADVVSFCQHIPVVITDSISVMGLIRDVAVKAALVDYMMPKLDGIELLTIIQESRPDIRRVLITAAPNEEPVRLAMKNGIVQMLVAKPPNIADIKLSLAWL